MDKSDDNNKMIILISNRLRLLKKDYNKNKRKLAILNKTNLIKKMKVENF